MSTEQDVRNRVLLLLGTKAAQQIDFKLDEIHVNPTVFSLVAGSLVAKQNGGRGIGFRFGQVSPKAGASYNPSDDVFDFRTTAFGQTAFDRAAIIHESVHAWLDLRMPTLRAVHNDFDLMWRFRVPRVLLRTRWFTDEAAAYVAGELFHIYDTATSRAPAVPPWATNTESVFGQAHRIAKLIANRPGAAVPESDFKTLCRHIKAEYTHITSPNGHYNNNGV